jgi:hypothetical protein
MTTPAAPSPICFIPLSFAPLAQWLTLLVTGLRQAAAARASRDHAVAPLVMLLWTRLARLTARFDALVARLTAGHPAAPARQRTRPASTAPARKAPAAGLRLPRGQAWLIRLLPGEAACFGGQLQALLADPQMAALLAAAPEAGRILRPLCRLLAIAPEGLLALPSATGKPTAKPRPAKPTPPPESGPTLAQMWAALTNQTPAAAPDPLRRKPPWLRPA